MNLKNKEKICTLLKGIETGDAHSVSVVNEAKYIQHNPQTHDSSEGLAALFKRLSETSPKVNIVRVFEDGDFVFAQTEYDFDSRNIGFEIFRFEDGLAVEHWDNIQKRQGPNKSNHSMVDGVTKVTDGELTESNRLLIEAYVEEALINKNSQKLNACINATNYIEHHPLLNDDLTELRAMFAKSNSANIAPISYTKCHRILADGNFVLTVCEGFKGEIATSFFDLYRVDKSTIVERWNTTEAIPSRSEWKNNNGKF